MTLAAHLAQLAAQPKPQPTENFSASWAWVMPDGKFYACTDAMQHIWLAEQLGKTEHEAERAGWIKLTRLQGDTLIIGFRYPTERQIETLMGWGEAKAGRIEFVLEWLRPRVM